jgi:hypothetical protein
VQASGDRDRWPCCNPGKTPDETFLSALEDRDFDSMFVVEAFLQIFRGALGDTEGDHLPEELVGVGPQRLEPQLIACAARELVTAFAHRVPVVLLAATRLRPALSGTRRIAGPLLLVA